MKSTKTDHPRMVSRFGGTATGRSAISLPSRPATQKGGKLGPQTRKTLALREQRYHLYDQRGVRAGVANYQVRAYETDLEFAVRLGKVKQADMDRWLAKAARDYDEAGSNKAKRKTLDNKISTLREELADAYFGEDRISGVLKGLREAGYTVERPVYR